MMFKRSGIYFFICVLFVMACIFYIHDNYKHLTNGFDTVKVELNQAALKKGLPILYAYKGFSTKLDFKQVYKFKKTNDSTIVLKGLNDQNISGFRIYFEYPGQGFDLKRISFLKNSKNIKTVSLSDIDIHDKIELLNGNFFNVVESNGFFELPFKVVHDFHFLIIALIIVLLSLLLIFFFAKIKFINVLKGIKRKELIFILFLMSIFSFHPLYNILLIVGLLFYIKNLNLKTLFYNKTNILFFSFFSIYLINSVFLREGDIRDFSMVEKYLPFIFLPLLLSSINLKNSIYFLMLSGLCLSFVLFSFSLIDYLITHNIDYFSFENFSKYFHPVYLSYLIFLSICYLENRKDFKYKVIIQLFFVIMLVLLGSKLVLIGSIVLYVGFYGSFVKNIKKALIFSTVVLIFVLMFKPLQTRFNEVLKVEDLTVLNEEYVDSNDPRINGLTIRLLVWKEVLLTFESWKECFYGKGVSKSRFKELGRRLNEKGLVDHATYNPHNQFIDTFWRTGFFGLFVLVSIPILSMLTGIRLRNKLLIVFSLFMFIAMTSESVFGRVRGVYFFATTLILLSNYKLDVKDSNFRNPGNSK